MIPNDIYKAFMESGSDWADKLGAAELLEGALKSLKAKLSIEAKETEGCGVAEAENHALASQTYRQAHVEAVRARVEANRAKVRYDAQKALFDAQRTQAATERAALGAAT